jgi:hypothetical protein
MSKNLTIQELSLKFLVFQECIFAWIHELDLDLKTLIAENENPNKSKVIPFPQKKENN